MAVKQARHYVNLLAIFIFFFILLEMPLDSSNVSLNLLENSTISNDSAIIAPIQNSTEVSYLYSNVDSLPNESFETIPDGQGDSMPLPPIDSIYLYTEVEPSPNASVYAPPAVVSGSPAGVNESLTPPPDAGALPEIEYLYEQLNETGSASTVDENLPVNETVQTENQTTYENTTANETAPVENNETGQIELPVENETINPPANETVILPEENVTDITPPENETVVLPVNETLNETINQTIIIPEENVTENVTANITIPVLNASAEVSFFLEYSIAPENGKFIRFVSKKNKTDIVEIESDVMTLLNNNETVRIIVKAKKNSDFSKLKLVHGKSKKSKNFEVLEINKSSLSELLKSGAEKIYLDRPMTVALSDALPLMGIDKAQSELNLSGEGIGVCLLDTGADDGNVDFAGKVVSGYDFVNSDANASDDNGHGTTMARVIHAVAPNATLIAVKVLNENGTGYSSDIMSGIDYCQQQAAVYNIKVISMSFGGGQYTEYCDMEPVAEAANNAVAAGLFAAAATGNNGAGYITAPACGQDVTAVASTAKSDVVSSFSNMNGMVDLLATGENVNVAGTAYSGTSVSTADVAGAAALLAESNSSMLPAELEQRFKTTGKLIEFNSSNYSRIDVYNAILNNATGTPTNQTVNETNETGNGTYNATIAITSCQILNSGGHYDLQNDIYMYTGTFPYGINQFQDTGIEFTGDTDLHYLTCFGLTGHGITLDLNGYHIYNTLWSLTMEPREVAIMVYNGGSIPYDDYVIDSGHASPAAVNIGAQGNNPAAGFDYGVWVRDGTISPGITVQQIVVDYAHVFGLYIAKQDSYPFSSLSSYVLLDHVRAYDTQNAHPDGPFVNDYDDPFAGSGILITRGDLTYSTSEEYDNNGVVVLGSSTYPHLIDHVYAIAGSDTTGDGFHVEGMYNNLSNCYAALSAAFNRNGYHFWYASNSTLEFSETTYSRYPLFIEGDPNIYADDGYNKILNNTFGGDVGVADPDYILTGIRVDESQNNTIAGNRIIKSKGNGILIEKHSSGSVVSDNRIEPQETSLSSAILVNNSENVTLRGNSVYPYNTLYSYPVETTRAGAYGIRVSGSSNNVLINRNNISDVSYAGILTESLYYPVIANNTIAWIGTVSPTAYGMQGIYVNGGAYPTVINNTVKNVSTLILGTPQYYETSGILIHQPTTDTSYPVKLNNVSGCDIAYYFSSAQNMLVEKNTAFNTLGPAFMIYASGTSYTVPMTFTDNTAVNSYTYNLDLNNPFSTHCVFCAIASRYVVFNGNTAYNPYSVSTAPSAFLVKRNDNAASQRPQPTIRNNNATGFSNAACYNLTNTEYSDTDHNLADNCSIGFLLTPAAPSGASFNNVMRNNNATRIVDYGFLVTGNSNNDDLYNNSARGFVSSSTGFYVNASPDNHLANNTAYENKYGFTVQNSQRCILYNNLAHDNTYGFYALQELTLSSFDSNRAPNNTAIGFYFWKAYSRGYGNAVYVSNNSMEEGTPYGFILNDTTNLSFRNNYAAHTTQLPFWITGDTSSADDFIYGNIANMSDQQGFLIENSVNMVIQNCEANNNSRSGFMFRHVNGSTVSNSIAYINGFGGGSGIYDNTGFTFANFSRNLVDNCTALENSVYGFRLEGAATKLNNFTNNNATNNPTAGYYLHEAELNYFPLDFSYATGSIYGYLLNHTQNNVVIGAASYGNQYGGYLKDATDGFGGFFYNNTQYGIYTDNTTAIMGFAIYTSPYGLYADYSDIYIGGTIYNCSTAGLYVTGLSPTRATNVSNTGVPGYDVVQFRDNTHDIVVNTTSGSGIGTMWINLSAVFSNPDLTSNLNKTSMHLLDSVYAGEAYSLTGSRAPSPAKPAAPEIVSLDGKYVNATIMGGTTIFNELTFKWTKDDLVPLRGFDVGVELWQLSELVPNWWPMNQNPDIVNRTLVVTNILPPSSAIYGLMYNQSRTGCAVLEYPNMVYNLTDDAIDAPYMTDYQGWPACFVISADNVTLDCNGHRITDLHHSVYYDMAVFISNYSIVNGPTLVSNITVKNCNISQYDFGAEIFLAQKINLSNNTIAHTPNTGGQHAVGFTFVGNGTFDGNRIMNCSDAGFYGIFSSPIYPSGDHSFTNNYISNVGQGILLVDAPRSNITNNTIEGGVRGQFGMHMLSMNNLLMANNTVSGQEQVGVYIGDSDTVTITDDHYFDNTDDFHVRSDGDDYRPLTMNHVIFDGPSGSYTDYTNLSLYDILEDHDGYYISWQSPSVGRPLHYISFNNKYLEIRDDEISTGVATIQSLTWSWNPLDLPPGLTSAQISLWSNKTIRRTFPPAWINSWWLENNTPDVPTSTLSRSNYLLPSYDGIVYFGLFYNDSLTTCRLIDLPGAYDIENDLVGAPINTSEIVPGSHACIKITSSDVAVNCQGHSVTRGGGTSGLTMGVALVGPLANITLKNCRSVGDYDVGMLATPTSNSNFNNITFYNNTYYGIYTGGTIANNTFANLVASGNGNSGIYFDPDSVTATNNTFANITAANNTNYGLYIAESTNTRFDNITAYNNSQVGLILISSVSNTINNSRAYGPTQQTGFAFMLSDYSMIENSNASGNAGAGFYTGGSTHTIMSNVKAYDNTQVGIYINSSSTNNVIIGSNAYRNAYGIYVATSNDNGFANNMLYNNTNSGMYLTQSQGEVLLDNTIYNNADGILLSASTNNDFTTNEVYNNSNGIKLTSNSNLNNFTGNNIYRSAAVGFQILDSNNTRIFGDSYYNNTYDFKVNSTAANMVVNMTYAYFFYPGTAYIFGHPVQIPINITNLTLYDVVPAGTSYTINWSTEPAATLIDYTSFNGKYLNFSNFVGSVSIDKAVFNWNDDELGPFNEGTFKLTRYNSTWNVTINTTPDVSANTLSTYNMALPGVYGIQQSADIYNCLTIIDPGTYSLSQELIGATENVSDLLGDGWFACIHITASNVTLNCNNFGVRNNGAHMPTAVGIVVNGTYLNPVTNVTLKNCYATNYTYGGYLYIADNGVFNDNTFYNNTNRGFVVDSSSYNNFSNTVIANNSGAGLFLVSGPFGNSNFNRFTNNTLSSNGLTGSNYSVYFQHGLVGYYPYYTTVYADQNIFQNTKIYSTNRYVGYSLQTAKPNNFTNTTMCYNETIGCINWQVKVNVTNANLLNGTTIILNPYFVSLNSSNANASQFKSDANITIDSGSGQCGFAYYKGLDLLPASKAAVIASSNTYSPNYKTCSNGIVTFATTSGFSGYTVNASGCMIVDIPGNYQLVTNAVGAPNSLTNIKICILIRTSNVSFDCNGYNITNDGTTAPAGTYGIYTYAASGINKNITITNCGKVANYTNGVYFAYVNDSTLINVTAYNNSGIGIWVNTVNQAIMANNTAYNNSYGINIDSIAYSNISNNDAHNNFADYNVRLGGSTSRNNMFINNTAYNGSNYGFAIYDITNNTLLNNTAYRNKYGIYLEGEPANNTFQGNTARNNTYYGFYLNATTLGGNNFISNTANNNTLYGFYVYRSNGNNFTSNLVYSNPRYGFNFENSNNSYIANNTAYNARDTTFGVGFGFYGGKNNVIFNNTAYSNYNGGIVVTGSRNHTVANNTIRDAIQAGITFFGGANNTIANNTVSNSTLGIYLLTEVNSTVDANTLFSNTNGVRLDVLSDKNVLSNNIIQNNTYGMYISNSTNNTLLLNTIQNGSISGVYLSYARYTNLTGNLVYRGQNNFYIVNSNYSYFAGNYAENASGYGFRCSNSNNNTFITNDANGLNYGSNTGFGFSGCNGNNLSDNYAYNNYVDMSFSNTRNNFLYGNVLYDSGAAGLQISNSTMNAQGGRFYNNGPYFPTDIAVYSASTAPFTINISAVFIESPIDNYQNYTNISINDVVRPSEQYSIAWSAAPSATFPFGGRSFHDKYLRLTGGFYNYSIDQMIWGWTANEVALGNYNEYALGVWLYNGGWGTAMVGSSPNVATHTIVVSSINYGGTFGLLESNMSNCPFIRYPGTYVVPQDYLGAPNDASEVLADARACIKIGASNVTLDCNGSTILQNVDYGTAATMGILLNDSLTNVTIKNCKAVTNYTFGIYSHNSNDSVFDNNSVYNLSETLFVTGGGFYLDESNNNTLSNNLVYNMSTSATGFYIQGTNNTVVNNTASLGSYGFEIYYLGAENNTLINNNATGMSFGFYIQSNYNAIANNTASNSFIGFQLSQQAANNTLINNTAYNNSEGFEFYHAHNNTMTRNTAYLNEHGYRLLASNNNNLSNNTAYNNTANGFYLTGGGDPGASQNMLTYNTAYNNSNCGFLVGDYSFPFADGNQLYDNTAWRNNYGFCLNNYSNNTYLFNNTALNNSKYGFYLNGSSNNNVVNNTAQNNSQYGFYLLSAVNNTLENNTVANGYMGFGVDLSSANNFTGNNANNNTRYAFYLMQASLNNFVNNTAYDSLGGFNLLSSSHNIFTTNLLYNNSDRAIYVDSGSNNTFIGNFAQNNSYQGFYLTATAVNLTANTVSGNSGGVVVKNSSVNISNDHYYNNSIDLWVEAVSTTFTVNMTNVSFDNPSGNFINFTALAINDLVQPNTAYSVKWSSRVNVPVGYFSFENKFVEITNNTGPVAIDGIVWSWTADEVALDAKYNESNFELWRRASNGRWYMLNRTPDLVARTLSLTNMNPASIYAILDNNNTNCMLVTEPGDYYLIKNQTGSPNDASEFIAGYYACIKILTSDVLLDCDGYTVTNDNTSRGTFGIVTGTSLSNVTVKNCPGISNYTYGVYVNGVNQFSMTNSTVYNTSHGFWLDPATNALLSNDVVYNTSGIGFYSEAGDNVTFSNNLVSNSGDSGFYVTGTTLLALTNNTASQHANYSFYINSIDNATIANNNASNNLDGFYLKFVTNTAVVNSTVTNSSDSGFYVSRGSGDSFLNAIIRNTQYGFNIYSNAYTNLTNVTVYDSTVGFNINSTQHIITLNSSAINGSTGFKIFFLADSTFKTDNAINNSAYGFYSELGSNNLFNGTQAVNSNNGFYLFVSTSNNLTNITAQNNSFSGLTFNASLDNIVTVANISGSQYGYSILNSNNTNSTRVYLSSLTADIYIESNGDNRTVYFYNSTIDNPAGGMHNFTNFALSDVVYNDTAYLIQWSAQPATLPPLTRSFDYKFLNLTVYGTDTLIDNMTWYWTDAEVTAGGYNETKFNLFEHNGTWRNKNTTPDTGANTLALSDVPLSGVYGILQNEMTNCPNINESGEFEQPQNYIGAPNSLVLPSFSTRVCVNISASNVVFDCLGYNITNDGTSGPQGSIAVATHSASNVTVRNCNGVSNYSMGLAGADMNDSFLYNNTVFETTNAAFTLAFGSYNTLLENNTARDNSGDGFSLYYAGSNNTLNNNTAYNDSAGFDLYYSNGNRLTNNLAYEDSERHYLLTYSNYTVLDSNLAANGTGGDGITLHDSSYNNMTNNLIYNFTGAFANGAFDLSSSSNFNNVINNTMHECALGYQTDAAVNNTFENNTGYNIVPGMGGYGFSVTGFNHTVRNNTIFNATYGIGADSDDCLFIQNDVHDVDTGIYLESSNNNIVQNNSINRTIVRGIYVELSTNSTIKENNLDLSSLNPPPIQYWSCFSNGIIYNGNNYSGTEIYLYGANGYLPVTAYSDISITGYNSTQNLSGALFFNKNGDGKYGIAFFNTPNITDCPTFSTYMANIGQSVTSCDKYLAETWTATGYGFSPWWHAENGQATDSVCLNAVNSYAAIAVSNLGTNNTVYNNTITNSNMYGIFAGQYGAATNYPNISYNTVYHTRLSGISTQSSIGPIIEYNNVTNTTEVASACIEASNHNPASIKWNDVSWCRLNGIQICGGSNNEITYNNITYSNYGVSIACDLTYSSVAYNNISFGGNGIQMSNWQHSEVRNNSIWNNSGSGISLNVGRFVTNVNSQDITIADNNIWNNDNNGIDAAASDPENNYTDYSKNFDIKRNVIHDNGDAGIRLSYFYRNFDINNNSVYSNGGSGIVLLRTNETNSVELNNIFNNSQQGIFLNSVSMDDFDVTYNNVYQNQYGLVVYNSSGARTALNYYHNNTNAGMFIFFSNNTLALDSASNYNSGGGLMVQNSENTVVAGTYTGTEALFSTSLSPLSYGGRDYSLVALYNGLNEEPVQVTHDYYGIQPGRLTGSENVAVALLNITNITMGMNNVNVTYFYPAAFGWTCNDFTTNLCPNNLSVACGCQYYNLTAFVGTGPFTDYNWSITDPAVTVIPGHIDPPLLAAGLIMTGNSNGSATYYTSLDPLEFAGKNFTDMVLYLDPSESGSVVIQVDNTELPMVNGTFDIDVALLNFSGGEFDGNHTFYYSTGLASLLNQTTPLTCDNWTDIICPDPTKLGQDCTCSFAGKAWQNQGANKDYVWQLSGGGEPTIVYGYTDPPFLYAQVPAGILVKESTNTSFAAINVTDTIGDGVKFSNSNTNSMGIASISGSKGYGLYVTDSNDTQVGHTHAFNSGATDFYVSSNTINRTVYLLNFSFDNPADSFENYTALDLTDTVEADTAYTINWTAQPAPLPGMTHSFRQKFINITNVTGNVSIDAALWRWTNAESATYDENKFVLYIYNGTWNILNMTADTSANSLGYYDFNPASDYGILQNELMNCPVINESGEFSPLKNYVGAPNNASPLADYACVKIVTSNVTFNCSNFTITNNGTVNSYGVELNGSLTNVTVKNCVIYNYTYGMYNHQSNYSVFNNNTVYGANQASFTLSGASKNNLTSNTAYNGSVGFYVMYASSNNTIADNAAYDPGFAAFFVLGPNANENKFINNTASGGNPTGSGFVVQNIAKYNEFINNTAFNFGLHGFAFQVLTEYNNLTNNTAYNNLGDGFYLVGGDISYNYLVNNTAYNNTNGFSLRSGTSFSSPGGNVFIENTAYNNTQNGFALSNSNPTAANNWFTNNTAFGNNYGFYLDQGNRTTLNRNVAHNNTRGFYLSRSSINNLTNDTAYDNIDGFYLSSSSTNNLAADTAYNNTDGFYLSNSSTNNLTSDVAYNNSYGFYVFNESSTILIRDSIAYNNSENGFDLREGSYFNLLNNTATNNSKNGFYVYGYSAYVNHLVDNNTAYNNTLSGFVLAAPYLNASGNNASFNGQNGIEIGETNNRILNNTANSNGISGFYVIAANFGLNIIANNTADTNTQDGFWLSSTRYNNLISNGARNNTQNGFFVDSSKYNLLLNNTAANNTRFGVLVAYSNSTNISGNLISTNNQSGLLWSNSYNGTVYGNTIFGNGIDTVSGDWQGITLTDSQDVDIDSNYIADQVSGGMPAGILAAPNAATVSRLRIRNNWFQANGIAMLLQQLSDANVTNNTAVYNYDGLLGALVTNIRFENNTVANGGPATYGHLGISDSANSYSVISGNNLTNNIGVGIGILNVVAGIPSSYINITNNYVYNSSEAAVFVNGSNHISLFDNQLISSKQGIFLNMSSHNLLQGNNATNNTQNGFLVYLNSDSNTLVNNFASGNSIYGFYIWQFPINNRLINNTAVGSGSAGIRLDSYADYNLVANNTAANNTDGILLQYHSRFNNITDNLAYNNTGNGISIVESANNLFANNTAYSNIRGMGLTVNAENNTIIQNIFYANTIGVYIDPSVNNSLINNSVYNNSQDGLQLDDAHNNTIFYNDIFNNSRAGMYLNVSTDNTIYNNTVHNNAQYGVYLLGATANNLTGNNITNNTNNGIYFDAGSIDTLYQNYICFNDLMDVNNINLASSVGSEDSCDYWKNWSEISGRPGCAYSCSSLWHRFYGNLSGAMYLTDNVTGPGLYVYQWNSSSFNVFFVDTDSAINWQQLQAIGRSAANDTSTNDFNELDTAFDSTGYADNIATTYSLDGTLPNQTANFTIYGRKIILVPVVNSSIQSTVFQTGILWDMGDGGSEYDNAHNQSTVWVVKANTSALVDNYGEYDYLGSIPYTLATREGATDTVTVYIELK